MSNVTVVVCDNARCKFKLGRKSDDTVECRIGIHNFTITIRDNVLTLKKHEHEFEIRLGGYLINYARHIISGEEYVNSYKLVHILAVKLPAPYPHSALPSIMFANAWLQISLLDLKTRSLDSIVMEICDKHNLKFDF